MSSPPQPGCIAKFVKDTSEIITSVAEATERKGMYQDAVRLYDLAQVSLCYRHG